MHQTLSPRTVGECLGGDARRARGPGCGSGPSRNLWPTSSPTWSPSSPPTPSGDAGADGAGRVGSLQAKLFTC